MKFKVTFTEDALADVETAFEYYKNISFELAISFRHVLDASVQKLSLTPQNYLNLVDGKHRRCKLKISHMLLFMKLPEI